MTIPLLTSRPVLTLRDGQHVKPITISDLCLCSRGITHVFQVRRKTLNLAVFQTFLNEVFGTVHGSRPA